jgi:hypothetical protein
MATASEWATAFARQAEADFQTFELIQTLRVPDCHKLQFLQMACEKLVKSHLCSSNQDLESLQTTHACIEAHLVKVLKQVVATKNYSGGQARDVLHRTKRLAQEIELLAPAVKRGGKRPDNCEYPWVDGKGVLHVPVDHDFYPSLLLEKGGITFLKLVKEAIRQALQK